MSQHDVCFLCSYSGKTEPIQTVKNKKSLPFYPWLASIHPAPGAAPPCPKTGAVQSCILCSRLLNEQWKLHEKRHVPQANRQYWTKAWSFSSAGFSREINLAATTTEPEVQPMAELNCVVCTEKCGLGPNLTPCHLIETMILSKIPQFASIVSAKTESQLPVCSKCFHLETFQNSIKKAVLNPTEITAPASSQNVTMEQAMLLYQFLMQNAVNAADSAGKTEASTSATKERVILKRKVDSAGKTEASTSATKERVILKRKVDSVNNEDAPPRVKEKKEVD